MMKHLFRIALFATLMGLLPASLYALKTDKVTLNNNMTVDYNLLPEAADSMGQAFSQGMLYGRLRANTFYYDWEEEDHKTGGKKKDNRAMGLGGSMVYKSAPFKGISTTFAMYTSQNPGIFREDKPDVGYVKAGKDTFSRNNVKNGGGYDGNYSMTVLGQAYLKYDIAAVSVTVGRQLFDSLYTASNDTKMVPNTFDGVLAEIKPFSDSRFQLAYFTAQKLRDHTHSHDVIAFDSWNENDDSAVNKTLTKDLVGNENELLIFTFNTKQLKNLNATIGYLMVPDVLGNLTLEAHYEIPMGQWSVTPGLRYMKQMDDLDAATAVANLGGKTDGYDAPNELDGTLYASRIDIKNGPLSVRLGYSKITNDADIVSPWRGFPTGGFTRAMGQYNWSANTRTWLIKCGYDFNKAGLVPGFRMSAEYAIQNFDDQKSGVQADSNLAHVDFFQTLSKNTELKFRVGHADGDDNTRDMNGALKTDISYTEYRLDLNYCF